MIVLFFLLSFFSLQADEVHVNVTQSAKTLFMDELLRVSLEVSYPEGLTVKADEFLSELHRRDMPSFSIVSEHVEKTPGFARFSFELQPQNLGRCIFAPGFLHFDPDNTKVLLPAVEAMTKNSGVSDLVYVPPLPLYPEQKIDLSLENSLKLMSKEALQAQVRENKEKMAAYQRAWGYVMAFLLLIATAALLFWVLFQYDLALMAKKWLEPKKDPLLTLLQEAEDKDKERGIRWQALFHLVQRLLEKKEKTPCAHATVDELMALLKKSSLSHDERAFFTQVCTNIEAVSYANQDVSDEVLDGYCERVSGIMKSTLGK